MLSRNATEEGSAAADASSAQEVNVVSLKLPQPLPVWMDKEQALLASLRWLPRSLPLLRSFPRPISRNRAENEKKGEKKRARLQVSIAVHQGLMSLTLACQLESVEVSLLCQGALWQSLE